MQVGYGILMEEEVYNFMREMELLLYKKFGLKKGLRQSPHITVKPPFITEDSAPYEQYLDELCAKINPFEIEIDGFNSFGTKVIYLDIKKNINLINIHQVITSDLKSKFNHYEQEEMIFHGTLAYDDIDEKTFNEAYEFMKANFHPKFKIKAQKIGLFFQLPDDSSWVVIKEQALRSISAE